MDYLDTSGVTQLIVTFILILLAAFFSSAESAFSSVNKLRIKSLADDGNKKALKVHDLLEQPSKMVSSILIGNIIVVIAAATITTVFTINTFAVSYVPLAIIILTIIIIFLGEITPKLLAARYSETVMMTYVNLLYVFSKIMSPLAFVFNTLAKNLLKLFKLDSKEETYTITEDELLTIVDVSHEEGVIESEERKMITNVVGFGDSVTKDVMVPRTDMICGSINMSYEELTDIFSIYKYTRIPLYQGSKDNIVGIINLKDLFFDVDNPKEFNIKDIMREPYFTFEYKRTFELFHEMKTNSISIAIVLDEYGDTAGLVTLEDLIEEIVGEIRDEYDEDEEDAIQVINETEFLIDGNTNVDEINQTLGTELVPVEYENIAGHMIYLFDHIPKEGESFIENNVLLTVDTIVKNRIDKVKLEVLAATDVEESESENKDPDTDPKDRDDKYHTENYNSQ